MLWRQAEAHAGNRQWAEAAASFRAILALSPEDPRVLVQLSYVESLAGHYRDARGYLLRACRAKPRDPDTARELVSRLRTFNEAEALQGYVDSLKPLQRIPIPLLLAIAAQFSYLNQQAQALQLLDEAKRGDPDYPPTLMSRGQVLMYLGRFDEARADLARVLKRAPQLAQPYWLLAHMGKRSEQDNHVAAIRGLLARPGLRDADRILLGSALHKELDDLGDVEGAWQALEQACKAKRATLNYSVQDSHGLVDDLVALPVAPPTPMPGLPGRIPLFITGMHRSGTTLLEQLLDGSPQVHGVGEVYDFTSAMRYATDHHCKGVIDRTIVQRAGAGAVDFAEVGQRYLDGMAWRLGSEPFFTDKLPSNFLNIGFICRALPQARILHMVRDPVETCFSNLRELFSEANPYSYDQLELADYFLQYRRLMTHWHDAYPGRILDVDYAELTRDPEAVMRRVAAFCGIDFIDAMSDPRSSTRAVSTASAVQVRGRVVRREVPKWAPYASRLQPLINALRQGGVAIPDLPA
ncbi:MAG TPA: sulfotransferase [Thermomonas sp.]|nr:sulfotransferase [Thermomonas sp.]